MKAASPARLGVVLAALVALDAPGGAQRCPEGTDYIRTDDLGNELVIHCRRQKGLDAAQAALQDSEFGSRILAFLEAKKVPIRIDGKRSWAPDDGAAFNFVSKEILLPPSALERPAVSLAMSIAHEGYHAMQVLDRGMIPCIEAEQDTAFVQNVAYVEMKRRGAPKLALDDPLRGDFEAFRYSVARGEIERFDRIVRDAYQRRRQALLRFGGHLLVSNLLVQSLVRLCDVVWDLAEDYETLSQRRRHPAYLWDKRPVKRAEKAHLEDQEWKRQWVNEHRRELSRDF